MEFMLIPIMIFCHIVDDFYLQGLLAQYKQKEWWEHNAPNKLYHNDYKTSLVIHSMSWAFMIQLPILVWMFVTNTFSTIACLMYICAWLINIVFHAFVDNAKANNHTISLTFDQATHLIQILLTWVFWRSLVFSTTL